MTPKKLILVGGGTRSGKSAFALTLARRLGERRLFLATGQAGDAEMHARIERHRRDRGDDFTTVEEPLALAETIARFGGQDVVVIDCLTLWLSNLLLEGKTEEAIERSVGELADAVNARMLHAIVVTSEVGLENVPDSALGRVFRDVAGLAHQRLSVLADEVYLGVLGTMLQIKPRLALVAAEEWK